MSDGLAQYLPASWRRDFEKVAAEVGYPVESLLAGRIAWDEIKRLPTADERLKAVVTVVQLWRLSVKDGAK